MAELLYHLELFATHRNSDESRSTVFNVVSVIDFNFYSISLIFSFNLRYHPGMCSML